MTDAVIDEWRHRIRAAVGRRKPLRIRGGGTKDFYGNAPSGDVLDTTGHSGIIDYDPTELVITARSGTPLAEIESALRKSGQMLAFEPPHFGDEASQATLGGCVAAGLSGPRRPYAGAVRDLVLGVRIMDGKADELEFGGRVMKNVAGFDIARLMTGALGTLGVLLEISIKCVPLPKAETTRVLECSADESIRHANEWGRLPLPISATCFHDGRLSVRLSGAAPAVNAAAGKIGGSLVAEGEGGAAFWTSVREQRHAFFVSASQRGAPLWRLAVKSTAPYTDLAGLQLIEWGGGVRWLAAGERSDPVRLRAWAAEHGGHATLFRATDKPAGAFQPLAAPMLGLHRRLKATFDPTGIFNPGRLYAEF